jgi:hypothetical protein
MRKIALATDSAPTIKATAIRETREQTESWKKH